MPCCWLCSNTGDFHYEGKPSRATVKSTLFAVSKDEWGTKEDTGKSMKNALYVLQAPLGSNSEKVKPVALAIIELCLSGGTSQSVENSIKATC